MNTYTPSYSSLQSRAAQQSKDTQSATQANVDWWLFATVLILLCFGLLMVLSASGVVGERNFNDQYFFFKRQVFFVILGIACMGVCTFLSKKFINSIHYFAIFSMMLMLFVVLSPLGINVNGAQRWIGVFNFSIQPMEFAKISLVLYLSYFLSTHQDLVKTFSKGVIPPFAITGIFCLLLMQQPDFGSAMIMMALLFFLCLTGGTRLIYLVFSAGMLATTAVTLILTSPYRMRRLIAYMDPFKDAQGSGYQLVQSFYAFAEGGLSGVGMGNGRQKLLYLPEAHNDFIVSVIGEELGLVGVSVLMLLFLFMFFRCYQIIIKQTNLRDKLNSFGITLVLMLSVALNFAVVMGLVPPKGVAMPFLSYGGSSMIASLICIGLLLNYSRLENQPESKKERRRESAGQHAALVQRFSKRIGQ